jgi:exopolysaccharide biosynthesis protein
VNDAIVLYKHVCVDPTYRAFVMQIDLTSEDIEFFVTPYKQRRLVVSEFARRVGAVAATNGGFWRSEGGFTVSGGTAWPKYSDTSTSTVVGFGPWQKGEGMLRVEIRPTEETLKAPPDWMENALSGEPVILEDGVPQGSDNNIFKYRHPRTGIGYTKDRKTLFLVVVDGRQKGWSLGMKTEQLGTLFKSLGAQWALNLDGGSSSTMVIPSMGGLVNDPCFKKADERNVPNHLAIISKGKSKVQSFLKRVVRPWLLAGLGRNFSG